MIHRDDSVAEIAVQPASTQKNSMIPTKFEGLIDRSASDFGVICQEIALIMAFHRSAVFGCCCPVFGHVAASRLKATDHTQGACTPAGIQ